MRQTNSVQEDSFRVANLGGHTIYLAQPISPPECSFVGRIKELELCMAAWCIEPSANSFCPDATPLHFCLEGPPGSGKNEIVYELARRLRAPLFMMHGHEDFSPEDLAILIVPELAGSVYPGPALTLRASPLATAVYLGGLVFFDEINRVPEKALAPLASVLDGRQSVYSAAAGIHLSPMNAAARSGFRFCCALNPEVSTSGRDLPNYIRQRTLPIVRIDYPAIPEILQILRMNLRCTEDFIEEFERQYAERQKRDLSVREALTVLRFAMNYQEQNKGSKKEAIRLALSLTRR